MGIIHDRFLGNLATNGTSTADTVYFVGAPLDDQINWAAIGRIAFITLLRLAETTDYDARFDLMRTLPRMNLACTLATLHLLAKLLLEKYTGWWVQVIGH